jgi:hypothetical protein
MIENVKVQYYEWIKTGRKEKNKEWVSAVWLSKHGVNTDRLKSLCRNSEQFHAQCIDIAGSSKYYYRRMYLNQLLSACGEICRK